MVEQPFYIKIVVWLGTLFPAILGAAISLKIANDKNSSFFSRVLTFLAGVVVAYYAGGATLDIFTVNKDTMIDEAIMLAWGIFGMAGATQIWMQIPDLIKGIREALTALIQWRK